MTQSARRYRDALKVIGVLEAAGHQARLAGGCVRDRLLDREPEDYDVATTARPDAVLTAVKAAGFKSVPTGIAHGTVTIVMPHGPCEVTTLRLDVETDGRHATVRFATDFQEDAARRDFTMNAMFEDRAGTVYDFFGGTEDLRAGRLRFVGDAAQRIAEDYLRSLRCFRFWARFGFTPVPGTLEAIEATKDGLRKLSQERVTSELLKTLAGEHAPAAVDAMRTHGVLAIVVPELASAKLVRPSGSAAGLGVLASWALMAGLDESAMKAFGIRLKLSTSDTRKLQSAARLVRALADVGSEVADALLAIESVENEAGPGGFSAFAAPVVHAAASAAPAFSVLAGLQILENTDMMYGHRRHARLPVDGALLMSRAGIDPGPTLRKTLEVLRRGYLNGAWTTVDEAFTFLSSGT